VASSPNGIPGLHETVRMLAAGRLSEIDAAAGSLRAADPLLGDVVAADAAARVGRIGLAQLNDLLRRVEAEAGDPLLRWWVLAILGERAFLDADLGAIPLVAQVLPELPGEPFATLPLLYVRGRLRRIASAVYLVAPTPGGIADHRRLRDEAVADFLRADLTAEVALTRGLSAAIHAIATWDEVQEDLEIVRDARGLLGDTEGSIWLPVLDELQALVALTAGDLEAADAALAAVERRQDLHPPLAAVAAVGRAEHALVVSAGSATAVKDVIRALDDLRSSYPHLLGLNQLRIANLLADLGHTEQARSVGLAGLAWPPPNALMTLIGALLRARLEVLDGLPRTVDDILALLAQLAEQGHERRSGAVALRMARDFDRVGDAEAAATLRDWGLARVPDARHRTPWEQRWAQPPGATRAPGQPGETARRLPGAVPPAVTVRVLTPVQEVEVGGAPVPLRSMPAKLLLALLIAHPEPLHVEQAIDLLWPDAEPEVGRPRLNTVVHRLRTALDLHPAVLRRTGDVLLLTPTGWDVDLFRYRRALHGPAEDRIAAVEAMTGNLCHVQFPYDDHLIEQRRVIEAEVAAVRRGT